MSEEEHGSETWPDPNPLAQLDHCLRARPETIATFAERTELERYCRSLKAENVQPALYRLWDYWQESKSPSLTAWMNQEKAT